MRNRVHFPTILLASIAATLLAALPALALPDLQITSMSVYGTAKEGNCNKINMTVKNNGDEFTNVAGIDIFVATYTQGSSNLNRSEKTAMISPLQPGAQVSFAIDGVNFASQGSMTVQALVDSTQKVTESNENNNTKLSNVSVSGACYAPPPPQPIDRGGCDLSVKWTQPTSSSVPANSFYQWKLRFTNEGTAGCPGNKIKVSRYSSSCGGYGSAIGGSGGFQTLNPLAPNASQELVFPEKRTPEASRAYYCYKFSFASAHNDTNGNNHAPNTIVKKVKFQ